MQGHIEELYDDIYERYKAYRADHDFVVLEGSHKGGACADAASVMACLVVQGANPFGIAYVTRALALVRVCGPPDGPINVPSSRLEMNARVAAAVDAPVLMVLDATSDLTVEVRPISGSDAMELDSICECDHTMAKPGLPARCTSMSCSQCLRTRLFRRCHAQTCR